MIDFNTKSGTGARIGPALCLRMTMKDLRSARGTDLRLLQARICRSHPDARARALYDIFAFAILASQALSFVEDSGCSRIMPACLHGMGTQGAWRGAIPGSGRTCGQIDITDAFGRGTKWRRVRIYYNNEVAQPFCKEDPGLGNGMRCGGLWCMRGRCRQEGINDKEMR
jgi:hypothetical protein